jgi:hypothetical protein
MKLRIIYQSWYLFSHHFASDVSFGIIKHLLTRYSRNSKFIDPEIPTIDRGNSWYLGVNKLTISLIQSISINYLMHCIYFLIYFAISVTWRIVTFLNNEAPDYLSELIPATVTESNNYNLPNRHNISQPANRLSSYQISHMCIYDKPSNR